MGEGEECSGNRSFFSKSILQFFHKRCMIKPASRTDGLVLQEKRGPAGFVVRPLNSDAAGHGYDRGAGSPSGFQFLSGGKRGTV